MPKQVTNIRFKLNEASYFYNRIKARQENFEIFIYNLDDFISAARSIMWVLNNEYCKREGFYEWYDKETLLPKDELDFLNDKKRICTSIVRW